MAITMTGHPLIDYNRLPITITPTLIYIYNKYIQYIYIYIYIYEMIRAGVAIFPNSPNTVVYYQLLHTDDSV